MRRILSSATLGAGVMAAAIGGATALASAPALPGPTTPTTPTVAYESLSVANGHTAVLRRRSGGGYDVLVGRGTDLSPAPGLAPLKASQTDDVDGLGYAGVHAGTDAAGQPVLVYPRCRLVQKRPFRQESCDLYVYDVGRGTEKRVPGVARAGRNEFEGVMERGVLAYSASSSKPAESGLWYRTLDGRERRVARNPGRQLALHGRRIASVVSDGAKENGEEPCEHSTLVLRSTSGKTQVIARDCVDPYLDARGWTSPAFIAGALYWGRDVGGGPALFRHDLRTKAVEQASTTGLLQEFQPTSATSGIISIRSDVYATADDQGSADTLVALDQIRWTPRIRSVIKTVGELYPGALR